MDVAEKVAEAPSAEKATHDEDTQLFIDNVNSLCRRGKKIKEKVSPAGADPTWSVWLNKFHVAFLSSKGYTAYKNMFYRFWKEYRSQMTKVIITDEGVAQDKWLKNKEMLPYPGETVVVKKSSSSEDAGWSRKTVRCKGIVIFFFEDNPKHCSISIPLSEIYLAAYQWYKEKGENDTEAASAPLYILKDLYTIISLVIPPYEEGREELESNIKMLNEVIEELTPAGGASSGPSEGMGSSFEGIASVMKKVLGAAGMNINVDEKKIAGAVGDFFDEKATAKIGTVVNEVMKSMGSVDNNADIGTVCDKIGQVLQAPAVKDLVKETAQTVSSLQATIPTASTPLSEVEPAGNPAEQE